MSHVQLHPRYFCLLLWFVHIHVWFCLATFVQCAGTLALRVQFTDPRCRSCSFFQFLVYCSSSAIFNTRFSSRNAPYFKLDPSVVLLKTRATTTTLPGRSWHTAYSLALAHSHVCAATSLAPASCILLLKSFPRNCILITHETLGVHKVMAYKYVCAMSGLKG